MLKLNALDCLTLGGKQKSRYCLLIDAKHWQVQ
jgi:hypothetical protein